MIIRLLQSITVHTQVGISSWISIPTPIQKSTNPRTLVITHPAFLLLIQYMLDLVGGIRIVLVFPVNLFCQIRNHVEDLGDCILILYIYQLRSVFIDHQNS